MPPKRDDSSSAKTVRDRVLAHLRRILATTGVVGTALSVYSAGDDAVQAGPPPAAPPPKPPPVVCDPLPPPSIRPDDDPVEPQVRPSTWQPPLHELLLAEAKWVAQGAALLLRVEINVVDPEEWDMRLTEWVSFANAEVVPEPEEKKPKPKRKKPKLAATYERDPSLSRVFLLRPAENARVIGVSVPVTYRGNPEVMRFKVNLDPKLKRAGRNVPVVVVLPEQK